MHRRFFFPILFALLLSYFSFSCKDEITTPNDNKPGRRDYVWTVDTLSNIAPHNSYQKITGSSLNDLWICGDGESVPLSILHFNGKSWKRTNMFPDIIPYSLHSFGIDSTWFGDMQARIWCYKSNSFSVVKESPIENYDYITYLDMWQDSREKVFVSGLAAEKSGSKSFYGLLMEYSNNEFKYLNKPEIKTQFYYIRKGSVPSSNIYLIGVEVEQQTSGIYEYDFNKIRKIYSTDWNNPPFLLAMKGEIYFYFEKKIHKYVFNSFQALIDLSSYDLFGVHINGRNLNDIFVGMKEGIGHYNGNDVKILLKLNNSVFMNSVLFDDGIAIIYRDNTTDKYYIARGKLN